MGRRATKHARKSHFHRYVMIRQPVIKAVQIGGTSRVQILEDRKSLA